MLPFFIGLRYTRAKRRNHFISFISFVSILGIVLGVTVLITVLSVMNGFDKELRERILGMMPHVTVIGGSQGVQNVSTLTESLLKQPEVKSVTPVVYSQGVLASGDNTQFVMIMGIYPEQYQQHLLAQKMVSGTLDGLKSQPFGIVMGQRLAEKLNLHLGDPVTLVIPEATITPAGLVPRFKRFTLVGTFDVGYEYDTSLAYIQLNDAQKLLKIGDHIAALQISLDDLYRAPMVAKNLFDFLHGQYRVYDWTVQNGNYFEAVKLEKTLMFVMLTLIIAVAAFNILSTLVMMVTDKQGDIAILRTLGALPSLIMKIFIVQGMMIGVLGTVLGVLGGVILALNVTELVGALEHLFNIKFLSAEVYYISDLPSVLLWKDVAKICGLSLVMSFVATLYPAWRASQVQPAEVLRYE